jgi:hypothetical protein
MQIKTTTADKWFSKAVRIRNNWHCEYCGRDFSCSRAGLDCSHYIGRGNLTTRHWPWDAFAHCKHCHDQLGGGRYSTGDAQKFRRHYLDVFGAKAEAALATFREVPFFSFKRHQKGIAAHYKAEFERIEGLRKEGERRRVEIEPYLDAPELKTWFQIIGES